jgi:hypothetical protein
VTDSNDLVEYERTARAWARLAGSVGRDGISKQNGVFKQNHEAYKAVRDTEDGRRLIERLAEDPDGWVRSLAATHCLPFAPDLGGRVLATLAANRGELGFVAETTLAQHALGRLDLDW